MSTDYLSAEEYISDSISSLHTPLDEIIRLLRRIDEKLGIGEKQ